MAERAPQVTVPSALEAIVMRLMAKERADRFASAAAVLDAMSDAELAPALLAMGQLGSGELYLDRFAEGTAHSARTLAVARATNQGQLFPMLAPVHGIFLGFLGRLEESHALLDGPARRDGSAATRTRSPGC